MEAPWEIVTTWSQHLTRLICGHRSQDITKIFQTKMTTCEYKTNSDLMKPQVLLQFEFVIMQMYFYSSTALWQKYFWRLISGWYFYHLESTNCSYFLIQVATPLFPISLSDYRAWRIIFKWLSFWGHESKPNHLCGLGACPPWNFWNI